MNEYKDLNEILKLNLSSDILDEIKEKFNKRVFFDYKGSCKIGTLCGINKESLEYIIKSDDKDIYVSCFNSLTIV